MGKFYISPWKWLLLILLWSGQSYAAVHFTLAGSTSTNNLGLSTQAARSGSASIAIDVGDYLRLGVTHRQTYNDMTGYVLSKETSEYEYTKETNHLIANSLDIIIVLYYGQVFTPFLQLGMIKKDYYISTSVNKDDTPDHFPFPPLPNGGLGLGIRLNNNFSLKISYTASPGYIQASPSLPMKKALDNYTSVGITYNT